MKYRLHLMAWRSEYWLVYVSDPPRPITGIDAGNRPASAALGFTNHPRGPYMRPEDADKPYGERRHDYYVDSYVRRLTRQIAAESTFYGEIRWQGWRAEINQWVDPPPHGLRLDICISSDDLNSQFERDGWSVMYERQYIVMAVKAFAVSELQLIEAPWPKDLLDVLEE